MNGFSRKPQQHSERNANMQEWDVPRINERLDHLSVTEDGCKLFDGSRSADGYGIMQVSRGTPAPRLQVTAHRVAWSICHNSPIPAGLVIAHLCDQKLCCEPSHLLCTSQELNMSMAYTARSLQPQCHEGHDLSHASMYAVNPGGKRVCKECMELLLYNDPD